MRAKAHAKGALRWATLAMLALLFACAQRPPADDPDARAEYDQINDPLEPMNRAVFDFNGALDTVFLRPIAQGYRAVVPQFGRDRVADFLRNLGDPWVFVNDVLQGNGKKAGETLERFALNSSFGVLGIMDVAKPLGIPHHDADFGQTLGVWGVGDGPYLVLPIFGPSDPRDAFGLGVDLVGDPVGIYLYERNMEWISYTEFGMNAVVQRESVLDFLDDIRRTSLDYYATLRSLYRQHRAALIAQGKSATKLPAFQ